jgi:hypothetical protein
MQGPKYLMDELGQTSDGSRQSELLKAANKIQDGYTEMMDKLSSHKRDSGSGSGSGTVKTVVAVFKTVSLALQGLKLLQDRMKTPEMQEDLMPVASFLESAESPDSQIEGLLKTLSVDEEYTESEREKLEKERIAVEEAATKREKLKADWMHARDVLDYLPQALHFFGTADNDDVAADCKSYVTVRSRFLTAIGAKNMMKKDPKNRACMQIDRTCNFFDSTCSGKRKQFKDGCDSDDEEDESIERQDESLASDEESAKKESSKKSAKPSRDCECTIM